MKKLKPESLRRILERNFDVIRERSTVHEVVIICPEQECGDRSGNRSFNLSTNATNCWRCGGRVNAPGFAIPFLSRHHIDSAEQAAEDAMDWLDEDEFNLDLELDKPEAEYEGPPAGHAVKLPAGFVKLAEQPDSVYAKIISKMAVRKRLELQDFEEAGVGFTREGEWESFAIFPVMELGRVVYYQGRTYGIDNETSGASTKKFPSKQELPYGSRYWLYNLDQALMPETEIVIVVESILNVLSLKKAFKKHGWTNVAPVAAFKHKLSQIQLRKLLATTAKEVNFMYDSDATATAWIDAARVTSNFAASVTIMENGVDANDDADYAIERFEVRQAYSPIAALFNSL